MAIIKLGWVASLSTPPPHNIFLTSKNMRIHYKDCLICGSRFWKKITTSKNEWDNQTKYCSRQCYWEARKGGIKYPAYWKSKHLPEDYRKRISETCKRKGIKPKIISVRYGKDNNKWKGGITPPYAKIRHSFEYKQWRKAVFKRDNWTCQMCGAQNVILNTDHIKPFALYPKLRMNLANGRTLCVPCHQSVPTTGLNQWTKR